ncbi:IS91 family transposase [Undibacterium parvum]|nr:IS91 family transposase [Undibacterium parvum]
MLLPCQPPVIPMCHKPLFAAHMPGMQQCGRYKGKPPPSKPPRCIKPVIPSKVCSIAPSLVTSKPGSRLPLAASLMGKVICTRQRLMSRLRFAKPQMRHAFANSAYGFARVRCEACGHDFLVAFSCKGRGVCPSCNTRRMVETAAHLSDHIFPKLPVRQWVLSLPKRLRYFLQNDPKALNTALRIFLRVILASLQAHCPSAVALDRKRVQLAACAFIHRFGSSLNRHVHFHICVVDGVFEAVDGDDGDESGKVTFHALAHLSAEAIAQVQNEAKRRIVRAFVKRGLLDSIDGEVMLLARHGGGFSVDASVCIAADDRAGLERLLRYCARPPFAMERLHRKGQDHLLYHCPKPQSGGKQGDLILTPCEFIAKIAALVPPPRMHRHRYFGVLAPNSPLRAAVTAMAPMPVTPPVAPQIAADQEAQTNAKRSPARYLWAKLIARIYEVFPLLCLHCGGQMRLIAFINDGAEIRKILDHIGVESSPPKISQARGPPLWDACDDAEEKDYFDDGAGDDIGQKGPDDDVDQSVNW